MLYDIFENLLKIDALIQRRHTGAPRELARKTAVSERTVYEYLKLMKRLKAPIHYSAAEKSYYYKYPGRLVIAFQPLRESAPPSRQRRKRA